MTSLTSRLTAHFEGVPHARRWLLAAGLVLIFAAAALAAWLVLRPSYEVLFRDLKRQDAVALTAELEKEKIPFRYDETRAAILVPRDDARATRLKLMSRDLRLQGGVGLELFNNSDLGLTEFAQKVNYQRALQGELARTIMALDEIELARVHLTLPESSIFRRDNVTPKASVALFMRDGQKLSASSIRGIQRLVAASVPELSPADVSVLDATGAPASAGAAEIDDPALRLKQAVERTYERKIDAVITAALGAGHASVSVDAVINADQMRSTHESTVTHPLGEDKGGNARSQAMPLPSRSMPEAGLPPLPSQPVASTFSQEGTRSVHDVEQIVTTPGAVRRLSVAIVFDRPLPAEELTRLTTVAAASAGLNTARGDVLSTFVSGQQNAEAAVTVETGVAQNATNVVPSTEPIAADTQTASLPETSPRVLPNAAMSWLSGHGVMLLLAALSGIAILALFAWRSTKRNVALSGQPHARLSAEQREQYVTRLRTLLTQENTRES
jgi:flagellar M-ring protein FliF